MTAEIITIGNELLIGQVIDTNSAWIAQQLNVIGIDVHQITSISDDEAHIIQTLDEAQQRAQIIILTGGLGPTKDDITKKTLAKYFHTSLVSNPEVLSHVQAIFKRSNRPMLDINIQQAEVPENCTVLHNQYGTAPGMWFAEKGCIFISMPGVPFEMKYLMEECVIPKLLSHFEFSPIYHKTILTAGLGESFLAKEIEEIENALPPHIKLAYLPGLGTLRLRLSAKESDKIEVEKYTHAICTKISHYVITNQDVPIEKAILDLMEAKKLTLSTAESCTGGYIGHLITKHAGCSAVYLGGAISYSYELKERMLGVKPQTLLQYGAVSEETVKEMALGCLQNYQSDYAIAVSGIAGPGGATENKPVGTICFAIAHQDKCITHTSHFGKQRLQNIEYTASKAFSLLFQLIQELEG